MKEILKLLGSFGLGYDKYIVIFFIIQVCDI